MDRKVNQSTDNLRSHKQNTRQKHNKIGCIFNEKGKINDGKTTNGEKTVTIAPATTSAIQSGNGAVTATAIVTDKVSGYGSEISATKPAKTETKTVTVVDSDNGPQILTADVVVSNDWSKVTKIEKDHNADADATSEVVNAAALASTVKVTDQYGFVMSTTDKIVMSVTLTGSNASKLSVSKNATQNVSIRKAIWCNYYCWRENYCICEV